MCHCNENYQRSPEIEQFMTAKISGNALKQGSRTQSAQFTTAKIQGCANVSSYSNRSEGMPLGWQTPRVDSLKLAQLHKNWECAWSTQEHFHFLLWLLYVQLQIAKRACVSRYEQSAWSPNQWRSSKRSTYCKQRCATVLAQKTKRETNDAS